MSKYDSIETAAELVAEVQINGLSMAQEDICRAQDIFGHTAVEELARLANDIGRNNENGEPDPKGTWSSGRKGTQGTFYMIVSNIWNWTEVTRFWNLYTNPEHEMLLKLKEDKKSQDERIGHLEKDVKVEHDLRLDEAAEKFRLRDEVDRLETMLHERDMKIMELKAKLYDLVNERKEVS